MSRKNAGDSVKANGKVQTGKKFIDSIGMHITDLSFMLCFIFKVNNDGSLI